jgi:hypothetical protein
MYRHALPPGFVLKSQKKALDEAAKANTISLEEFLEVEVRPSSFYSFHRCASNMSFFPPRQRHKLGSNLTPVTPETFAEWKRTRLDKKTAELEALKKSKEAQNAAGKVTGMSGRDLFDYRPEYFVEEEDEESEDGGDNADGGGTGRGWDLEELRRETNEARERAEEEEQIRLAMEKLAVSE